MVTFLHCKDNLKDINDVIIRPYEDFKRTKKAKKMIDSFVVFLQICGFVLSISCGVFSLMVSNIRHAQQKIRRSNFYQAVAYFSFGWAILATSHFSVSMIDGIEGMIRGEIVRIIMPCILIGFLVEAYSESKESSYNGIDRRHGA